MNERAKAEFMKIWTERVQRDYADAMLEWLERETDFFEAPASTKHHGAHPGGLDDLKHRIGAMEARHRRELARRRIITMACMAILLLAIVWAVATACTAQENETENEILTGEPVMSVTPIIGEDPMEAEKIEEALLAQGYLSDAVPLSYDLQDVMRTACEEYGCPYSLALAVAEVESHFNMDAVGSAGEVGIMQLNPGPENTYWVNLEAETNQDPTTPAGNIVCGVYLLGAHLANYGDTEKAVMAYNMGNAGAERAWENGVTSTGHSEKVMEAMARWEAVVG